LQTVRNVADPSIDSLYEQVRALAPLADDATSPRVEQVATGIRVLALRTPTLPPATRTNTYLVGPERGAQVLVDPGSPYPDQQRELDTVLAAEAAAGRPLETIVLTHHHGDHVGGATATATRWHVPIAAHAATARRLAGRVAIARELGDGEVVDAGGVAMTCVHTPGHADGHLCFETADAIVAGDMVAGVGWILVDPSEGDMATYLASLRALLARPPKLLLPAHGPTITDGHAKLRDYIAHRTMREDLVVAALGKRADASPDELLAEVYADTPRPLWPIAVRVLRAHLDKLVHDGRARASGGRWALA
jgi:glyoxylase-like metal-dependent hydrolase (beta-lactamase superfamily II)